MIPIKKVEVDGIGYKISGKMEGYDSYRIIINSEQMSSKPANRSRMRSWRGMGC